MVGREAQIPDAKATAPSPGVSLTDSISVSHELHRAGAVLLTTEEAEMLPSPGRKAPLLMAGVMAVLVLVLTALAIDLAHRAPSTVVGPPPPMPIVLKPRPVVVPRAEPPAAVQAQPAPAAAEDDLLSPLTPRAAKKVRRSARPTQVSAQGVESAAAPAQGDFGFLEEEPELKRPTF